MPELPEVEVVRAGVARHVVGATLERVEILGHRVARRHEAGPDDLAARLTGRRVAAVRRRGKYLWWELAPTGVSAPLGGDAVPGPPGDGAGRDPQDAGVVARPGSPSADAVPDEALVIHLGMSGQLLVADVDAPRRPHQHASFELGGRPDAVGRRVGFVDQRTFGGLSLVDLVPDRHAGAAPRVVVDPAPVEGSGAGSGRVGKAGTQDASRAPAPDSVTPALVPSDVVPTAHRAPGADDAAVADLGAAPSSGLVPASVAHIAPDPFEPAFDPPAVAAAVRRRDSAIKRVLLDQTVISGVGNIYADEALWRARLHGERPARALSRAAAIELLGHVRDVMGEALAVGGTSFDALYVDVDGESGYFARSLNAYGRQGAPCPRCGTPIRRESFMNRSSFSCPRCQRRPRTPR